jgi:transposase-like protein
MNLGGEGEESWTTVLRDLKRRGMWPPTECGAKYPKAGTTPEADAGELLTFLDFRPSTGRTPSATRALPRACRSV